MKTDNELIAEFMGYEYFPYRDDEKGWLHGWMHPNVNRKFGEHARKIAQSRGTFLCRNHGQLRYSTSWDWLMPVVEKIEEMNYVVQISAWPDRKYSRGKLMESWVERRCKIEDEHSDGDEPPYGFGYSTDSKIESVYKAIVEFIKWYNSQPPQ